MRKTVFSLLACLCLTSFARLVYNGEGVDFGTFPETGGKKTVRIHVVNEGTEPTAIMRIQATCGCTAADFDDNTIMPGDSAWVDVTYNPEHRPGRFDKKIKIYEPGDIRLEIPVRGVVIGTPESVKELFPIDVNPLMLTEKTLIVPEIKRGEAKHIFINAYNVAQDTILPQIEGEYPEFGAAIDPAPIPPGEIGTLAFFINTREGGRIGDNSYNLNLYPDIEAKEQSLDPLILEFHINITE